MVGWKKVKNFTKRHDNEQRYTIKNSDGLVESLTLYKDNRGFWVVDTPTNAITFNNYYNARRQLSHYMKTHPNG